MSNRDTYYSPFSRRVFAWIRFSAAHNEWGGEYLRSRFWDEATHVFGDAPKACQADSNDSRWDKVEKKEAD